MKSAVQHEGKLFFEGEIARRCHDAIMLYVLCVMFFSVVSMPF